MTDRSRKVTPKRAAQIKAAIAAGDKQQEIADSFEISRSTVSDIATERIWADVPWPEGYKPGKKNELTDAALLSLLKKRRHSTAELADSFTVPASAINRFLDDMAEAGHLVFQFGDSWALEKTPASGQTFEYKSRPDGTYLFGFCGDTHLGSKYERLDVLADLYSKFSDAEVDRVFHSGNWIDGEARFNTHDLHIHGQDQQLDYLAQQYPAIDGLKTYAIAGDDHEGWYGQREGVDIGKQAERIFREKGRQDWFNLGFMEAFINLRNASTGESSPLLVMHPGGGSAYAHSYKPQKIVESFAGGEKPAVLLIGHYHKISQNIIRNVWAIQTGCTQDQTPFMRKRGIDAHVGGGICKLTQDEKGAIVGCQVEFFCYYNRGYYNDRWSHGGKVNLPERGARKRRAA